MFNPGDRVRVIRGDTYKDHEFVVSSDRCTVSLRCEYCADCSHLTVECPGLRHDTPIAKAFKEKLSPRPAPLVCSRCGEASHPGRKMFCPEDVLLCGDCVVSGTPLTAQPIREPERINYHAGMTPTWDWVGDT